MPADKRECQSPHWIDPSPIRQPYPVSLILRPTETFFRDSLIVTSVIHCTDEVKWGLMLGVPMERPPELPDYENPPLVEVVLGVQFEQLQGLGAVHYGYLWDAFREDFPRWEEKPPLAPAFELPRSGGSPNMSVRVELGGAMLPRLWMVNDNDTRLIQVQPDRLVVNWRKVGGDDVYPRYEAIREQFTAVVDKFSAFLAEQELDELRVNQCEITYINHIPVSDEADLWEKPEGLLKVFRPDGWDDPEALLEDVQVTLRHQLVNSDGQWVGRLVVQAQPAVVKNGQRVIALTISARGRPLGHDLASVLEFMDWARMKIVQRFTSVTTPEMHQIWQRTQ